VFHVVLSNAAGATIIGSTGTATIVNDDAYGPSTASIELGHGVAVEADLLAGGLEHTAWSGSVRRPMPPTR